jgi:Leucine rich repeat
MVRPEFLLKDESMRFLLLSLAFGLLPLAAGCVSGALAPQQLPTGATSPEVDAKARQQQMIAAIQKKGGAIRLDQDKDRDDPDKSVIVADLHGIRPVVPVLDLLGPLTRIQELNLYATDFTDADLERLRGLPDLHTLNLSATKITDAGLATLRSLPNLRILYLSEAQVTDAGLQHLKGLPNLKDLSLFRTRVTDEGLALLGGMKNLQKLILGDGPITDRGLAYLRGLTDLRELDLVAIRVSDARIEELKAALPHLKIVYGARR